MSNSFKTLNNVSTTKTNLTTVFEGCWEDKEQAARWNLFVHKIGKPYTDVQQICFQVCLVCRIVNMCMSQ